MTKDKNDIPALQSGEVGSPSRTDERTSQAIEPSNIMADSHDARLSRIVEYQLRGLAKDDPLDANLGSINSGLMWIALWLEEIIKQAAASGPRSIERLQDLMPAIDTHLRVTRQVDRFAQTELRAKEARRPKADNGSRTASGADTIPELPIRPSEDS